MAGFLLRGPASMLNSLFSLCKGSLASLLLVINTLVIFACMIPVALVKLVLRFPAAWRVTDDLLNRLAEAWILVNVGWITLVRRVQWDIEGLTELKPRGWYLLASNHQSWADIMVLQKVFLHRIPFLKFFLKHELIYVPVVGLAWWALDFPFMRRKGGTSDLEATRKACERFRLIPTSVINFLEGTRFTRAKHDAQRSPFQYLLKPKVGGIATALATMGEKFDALLDVTIHYPDGVPTFWDLLCGRVHKIVVRVRTVEIPPELVAPNAAPRGRMQSWVQEVWEEKDRCLHELHQIHGPHPAAPRQTA